MTDKPSPVEITPIGDILSVQGSDVVVELWAYGTYASDWFGDAQKEVNIESDHARRREIIFAVCAIESYLVEWVRDDVLNRSFRHLANYFPVKDRNIGIDKRWRRVIERLYTDSKIRRKPTLGGQYWDAFTALVRFRNGIVHGRTSRPESDKVPKDERPEPTVNQLAKLGPGGAVQVIAKVIRKLHEAVGTTPPGWLQS